MRRVASEMDWAYRVGHCVSHDSRAQGSQIETHQRSYFAQHRQRWERSKRSIESVNAAPRIASTLKKAMKHLVVSTCAHYSEHLCALQKAVKHPKMSTSSLIAPSCLDAEPQICCGHEVDGEQFGFVDFMVWFRRHGLASSTWSGFVNMVWLRQHGRSGRASSRVDTSPWGGRQFAFEGR